MGGYELSIEIERHAQAVRGLKKAIEKLPPGRLKRVKNGLYSKYYQVSGPEQSYIPSRDKITREGLRRKEYLLSCMEAHKELKLILEQYRDCLESSGAEIKEMLRKDPPESRSFFREEGPFSEAAERWISQSYTKDPKRPSYFRMAGTGSLYTASRADALIAEELTKAAIPFRYAAPLPGAEAFYPTFTILDPGIMKVWYWEHLGKLDDTEQVKNALDALKICFSHRLFPWNALIVSSESEDHPLGRAEIGEIIRAHFPLEPGLFRNAA